MDDADAVVTKAKLIMLLIVAVLALFSVAW